MSEMTFTKHQPRSSLIVDSFRPQACQWTRVADMMSVNSTCHACQAIACLRYPQPEINFAPIVRKRVAVERRGQKRFAAHHASIGQVLDMLDKLRKPGTMQGLALVQMHTRAQSRESGARAPDFVSVTVQHNGTRSPQRSMRLQGIDKLTKAVGGNGVVIVQEKEYWPRASSAPSFLAALEYKFLPGVMTVNPGSMAVMAGSSFGSAALSTMITSKQFAG